LKLCAEHPGQLQVNGGVFVLTAVLSKFVVRGEMFPMFGSCSVFPPCDNVATSGWMSSTFGFMIAFRLSIAQVYFNDCDAYQSFAFHDGALSR
jgi:hypothetical protein